MRLVKQSVELISMTPEPLKVIERAGRTAYKSEAKITDDSAEAFVARIIKSKHLSVLEHASVTYKAVTCRGVSHELVRHRIASYTQESTRYCNYDSGCTFIIPPWVNVEPGDYEWADDVVNETDYNWVAHLLDTESYYKTQLRRHWRPEQARGGLLLDLKTEIVFTFNMREWLHFFSERYKNAAHPQMQELAKLLLDDLRSRVPVIFDAADM